MNRSGATALVRVSPEAYNQIIDTYKVPIVGFMEMGLVAAVLYHALNKARCRQGFPPCRHPSSRRRVEPTDR